MQFTHTQEQLKAAQNVLAARLFYSLVDQDHKDWIKLIIASGNFHHAIEDFDRSTIRLNRLIAIKAKAAGYYQADRLVNIALEDLSKAENELLRLTLPLHQTENYSLLTFTARQEAVSFVLTYFSPVSLAHNLPLIQDDFFSQRCILSIVRKWNHYYRDDSYRQFLLSERFVPLPEMYNAFVYHDGFTNHDNVEGVWIYHANFYLYQLKDGCQWQYSEEEKATKKYVLFISQDCYQSNHKTELQFILFAEYLKYMHVTV